MIKSDYLKESKNNLIRALSILLDHIKDKNTDANKDFFPAKIKPIREAIDKLEKENLTLETLKEVSDLIGFKRVFPLIELAEKPEELENTVIKRQKLIIESYKKWDIPSLTLEKIFEKHKLNLVRFVLEGIFRKGLVSTDREAWSSIMYNMGGRTIYEYVYAVTNGWLHEDIISIWFKNCLEKIRGLKIISISQTAHDSNRVFKYIKENQNITGEPDFLIKIKYGKTESDFFLEIQHVSAASVKKRANLIQVPSHRVKESRRYGKNYIFVVPFVNSDGLVDAVSVIPGPLVEVKEDYIKGYFIHPSGVIPNITKFVDLIAKSKSI